MTTTEEPEVYDDIIQDSLQFLEDPASHSYDFIYNKIWTYIEDKKDLKSTILVIIDNIIPQASFPENVPPLPFIAEKVIKFKRDVELLMNLFIYYDASLEGKDQDDLVVNMATNQISKKYFNVETTMSLLQKSATEAYSALINQKELIPQEMSIIAKYIYAISASSGYSLYNKIFNQAFSTDLSLYITTLNINEKKDILEVLSIIYSNYINIYNGINNILPPSTTQILKDLFYSLIINPEIERLTSAETIQICTENGSEAIHDLFTLICIGPEECQNKFVTGYKGYLKKRLEDIPQSEFDQFCSIASSIYIEIMETNETCFSGLLEAAIKSAFNRFLDECHFANKLCIYHEQVQEPLECIAPLCQFLTNDPNFIELYADYLARRLLYGTSSIENEQALCEFFSDKGIQFEQIEKIIEDFKNSPHAQTTIGNTEVSLYILNTFNWKLLSPIQFKPCAPFEELFTLTKEKTQILQKIPPDALVHLTDKYSTVEFSNGSQTFELTFFHANIVQCLINNGTENPLSYYDIKKTLEISSDDELMHGLQFLINKKIISIQMLSAEGNIEPLPESPGSINVASSIKQYRCIFSFRGPPEDVSNFSDETEIPKRTIEPVHFANCNEQIEAAIYRFLKGQRYASIDKIREFVMQTLCPQFNVTNENIDNCIKRLVHGEYIIQHSTQQNCYKIRKA